MADQTVAETTVHACPPPGSGLTPCCGRTPFELPRTGRMSSDPAAVTCAAAPAVQSPAADRASVLRDFLFRLEQSAGDAAAEKLLDGNPDLAALLTAEPAAVGRHAADGTEGEAQPTDEDPARIDQLRPEFTEHASVESIDVQIRRARRQRSLWDSRVQKLTDLRQARVDQMKAGSWPEPATEGQQDGAQL